MEPLEQVEAQDPELENSPLADDEGERGMLDGRQGHADCKWNGQTYSDGATVCDSGTRRECWNGKWVEIGLC